MAIIAGEAPQAGVENRRHVVVPADEVVPGDLVRDQGRFRQVAEVQPSVLKLAVVWFFDPVEGYEDHLAVSSLASVSVWRASGVR